MGEPLLIIVVALMATTSTYWMIQKKKISPVQASLVLTIIFTLVTLAIPYEKKAALQAVFLGGSFVGMAEPHRVKGIWLVLGSASFSLLYMFFIPHLKGMGGALGLSAFISCVLVHYLARGIHGASGSTSRA